MSGGIRGRKRSGPCTKVRHANKNAALMAIRKTGGNVQMNAYLCSECKAWHIGHSWRAVRKMDRINQLLDAALK
jgi:hypothetical protein